MSIQCTILSTLCTFEHFLNKKLKEKKNRKNETLEKSRLTQGIRENLKIYS